MALHDTLLDASGININGSTSDAGPSIDLGHAGYKPSVGMDSIQPMIAEIEITTAGGGNGTVQLELRTGNSGGSGGVSSGVETVGVIFSPQTGSSLTKGKKFHMVIPPYAKLKRHIGIRRVEVGSVTGAIATLRLISAPADYEAYPDAMN